MNDFLKEVLRLCVPSKIQNELKMKKKNGKFGTNKRIRSVMVSTEAAWIGQQKLPKMYL